jgi:3-methyladenine DNA glycosylase AlkD
MTPLFINKLHTVFLANSNEDNASQMKAYMRDQFAFFGIKTKERRTLLKAVYLEHKQEVDTNIRAIVLELNQQTQREFHHCGMELFQKILKKKYLENDIAIIEQLIITNAWWDTVDFIAKQILGEYLLQFPEATDTVISKFSNSDHMWLQRSSIIFQLGYKKRTNEALLFQQCLHHKHSDEFFIQKAIGWALREYGKTNPQSVLNFVNSADLKSLSTKEAIRNITK